MPSLLASSVALDKLVDSFSEGSAETGSYYVIQIGLEFAM